MALPAEVLAPSDEDLVERLSRALSMRDEETANHIERMSRYSVVLAAAVGYTTLTPGDLRLAAALHDVGKIGVADAVLLKPGKLTSSEQAAMQLHSQIGHDLLDGSVSRVLHVAADIALTHHEWWDGNGYPSGLKCDEIPEAARIAAVADVFDALTSDRVYRPAMTFDEAIDIMERLRGSQFEPQLLDAFLASLDQISVIRQAYPDQENEHHRIRVLVVDDHEIFTQSLIRLLGSRPELKVVGTADSVASATAAAAAYRPDVVLMDFYLPDGDGTQATEQIRALVPGVRVVMLTARTDNEALARAIKAGCSGFVSKDETVDKLLAAIVAAFVKPDGAAPIHDTPTR